MDAASVPELRTAMDTLGDDDSVRAVVITGGVPGVFIRHYSVAVLGALSKTLRERGTTVDTEQRLPEREIDGLFERIETMPKPVIAAINGMAMGGGFELTLACDIRVAEEGDYELGLPEVNIGILPGAGGTQKLARLVGMGRALEMTLRGRTVSPKEALLRPALRSRMRRRSPRNSPRSHPGPSGTSNALSAELRRHLSGMASRSNGPSSST
jgi:enoyl-CoA hydratase